MKVLLFNGSPNLNGCTYNALKVVKESLEKNGIEGEIIQVGTNVIRDCIGCRTCKKTHRCIFNDDIVNELIEKCKSADGFVFGSPVYYAHPTGMIISLMNRLFYAGGDALKGKVASSIVCLRRAGGTASIDVLNKYFSINEMVIASSSYWNVVYGPTKEKMILDEEGIQTMTHLGENMAYLIKSLNSSKEKKPNHETIIRTNFNR